MNNKNNEKNNINKNNKNLISLEIRNQFGMSKKYLEPDDIDDNLINSLVEPIPDLYQYNKI